MATEITEIARLTFQGTRGPISKVRLLLLYPVTNPVDGVIPTPTAGVPSILLGVMTDDERTALNDGSTAFEISNITDRTLIPPDMDRRTRAYVKGPGPPCQLVDVNAEARLQAEEDALVADPAGVWLAGVQRHYAVKRVAFQDKYDEANRNVVNPPRFDAGGS